MWVQSHGLKPDISESVYMLVIFKGLIIVFENYAVLTVSLGGQPRPKLLHHK